MKANVRVGTTPLLLVLQAQRRNMLLKMPDLGSGGPNPRMVHWLLISVLFTGLILWAYLEATNGVNPRKEATYVCP